MKDALELMFVADQYYVSKLKEELSQAVLENMNIANVSEIFDAAIKLQSTVMIRKSIEFCKEKGLSVTDLFSEKALYMPLSTRDFETLCRVVASLNKKGTNGKMLQWVVKWCTVKESDEEKRNEKAKNLILKFLNWKDIKPPEMESAFMTNVLKDKFWLGMAMYLHNPKCDMEKYKIQWPTDECATLGTLLSYDGTRICHSAEPKLEPIISSTKKKKVKEKERPKTCEKDKRKQKIKSRLVEEQEKPQRKTSKVKKNKKSTSIGPRKETPKKGLGLHFPTKKIQKTPRTYGNRIYNYVSSEDDAELTEEVEESEESETDDSETDEAAGPLTRKITKIFRKKKGGGKSKLSFETSLRRSRKLGTGEKTKSSGKQSSTPDISTKAEEKKNVKKKPFQLYMK